jgi:M6 family metalloprotease-like protein
MMQTPWAIILCKFSGDASEPFPRKHYEDLFTLSGNGTHNMVDYFLDVSHGQIDVGGSTVLGWYTLAQRRDQYTGSGVNPQGRIQLVQGLGRPP